jgi:hypothetical protein
LCNMATSFKFSPYVILFLEKLTVAQLNKKLFIMFTAYCWWNLSWSS